MELFTCGSHSRLAVPRLSDRKRPGAHPRSSGPPEQDPQTGTDVKKEKGRHESDREHSQERQGVPQKEMDKTRLFHN